MTDISFECPRCERTWESIDDFEASAVDMDEMYDTIEDLGIPDPPADSVVALISGSLNTVIDELREERWFKPRATVVIHCGPCSIEMAASGRVPAHNTAAVAGAKHPDRLIGGLNQ